MSQYDASTVTQYFDKLGIAEFDRFDQSPVQRIKLHLHMRCLNKYVPSGSRVLELGAGPGRFTEALALLGCRIVVNDISSVQLRLNKERAEQNGYANAVEQWLQDDACDLAALRGEQFDAIVAFGGVAPTGAGDFGGARISCTIDPSAGLDAGRNRRSPGPKQWNSAANKHRRRETVRLPCRPGEPERTAFRGCPGDSGTVPPDTRG